MILTVLTAMTDMTISHFSMQLYGLLPIKLSFKRIQNILNKILRFDMAALYQTAQDSAIISTAQPRVEMHDSSTSQCTSIESTVCAKFSLR